MNERDNGGPAFPGSHMETVTLPHGGPITRTEEVERPHQGMTLRQWYAGQALAGILAGGFGDTIPHDDVNGGKDAAFFAFQYADAMLALEEGA